MGKMACKAFKAFKELLGKTANATKECAIAVDLMLVYMLLWPNLYRNLEVVAML
jgi:hypothetical protein